MLKLPIAFALAVLGIAYGQSITIAPANTATTANMTTQFTATVTGINNTNVSWSVGGVTGGNSTVGTISSNGLYTAPAIPPGQNPVTITATSTDRPSLSGSTYDYIILPGPTITSVSPNPITTGALTITITGTGFIAGAKVIDHYGSTFVAMKTLSVTPTTITASVWQGAAATATFYVQNPGPAPSNSLTVPIWSGPQTYRLTVNNGSGTGSYPAGAVVPIQANAPANGYTFANWTGATVSNSTSASTMLTMPAAATSVTANYSAIAAVPFPVTTHPRLWITTNDLAKLQSWASTSNPVYANGMLPALQHAIYVYNTQFFPGGVQNPSFPDVGDFNGYADTCVEVYAEVFAFNSLIDPNPSNRIKYAQYARNLIMVAMNQAVQGNLAGAPFRDPLFCQSNRANANGEDWGLVVDWIYNATDAQGNPILTAADKATIRQVFLIWANTLLTACATGGDHPEPVGVTNSLSLIGNGAGAYRMASNNYYLNHARLMTMMTLCMDPADDPAIDPTLSVGTPGNSLRSFLTDATGAWLYQEYAMMGDPQAVAADYGLSGNGAGFGLASGGIVPEGVLYGHSFSFILGGLLALQTAGFNNVSYLGPQAHLLSAPVWGRFVQAQLSQITPSSHVPLGAVWMGPIYQYSCAGDTLRTWVTPEQMQPLMFVALLEQQQGSSTHANAARWFAANVPQGGFTYNMSTPWSWSPTETILGYMLFDPSAPAPTDPRPSLPLTFFDPGAGQISSRTDWTPTATWFDYRASWESINHMQGDAGQFEFYRNGEWLTRGLSNYDNNWLGQTTVYHNTLGINNWCTAGTPYLNWFETGEWANGSQWNLGLNAGDPITTMSNGAGYVYANTDMTPLYNRPNIWWPNYNLADVTQATRQILWLNRDTIVTYDRATTIHPNPKTFNLNFQMAPVINGNVATETMPSGQQMFVQTLLPTSPQYSTLNANSTISYISDQEPMTYVMTLQDPSAPSDTRFLHVIQGADPGASMIQATYVTSTSGTAFDGAVFGTNAVFFPVKVGSVATTTFTVPFGSGTVRIAGLMASGSYGVSVTVNGRQAVVTLTPGRSGQAADTAGLLTVSF